MSEISDELVSAFFAKLTDNNDVSQAAIDRLSAELNGEQLPTAEHLATIYSETSGQAKA